MSAISSFCWFVCNCDSIVKFWGCGRLRDGLWKPDLASLHQTQGLVELNCKLWTAHRKCLFTKQTYMYFMAATLLLFYFGRQSVDISTWLQSNFLCFSSPFFFFLCWATLPAHTHSPPTYVYQNKTAFLAVAIFIFMEVWGPVSRGCFDRFRDFIVAPRAAVGVWLPLRPHLTLHLRPKRRATQLLLLLLPPPSPHLFTWSPYDCDPQTLSLSLSLSLSLTHTHTHTHTHTCAHTL